MASPLRTGLRVVKFGLTTYRPNILRMAQRFSTTSRFTWRRDRVSVSVSHDQEALIQVFDTFKVGRTGSGKVRGKNPYLAASWFTVWQSSLTLALLRCIFTEGNVYFDGLNTKNINLEAPRSNITIIPQTVSWLVQPRCPLRLILTPARAH